MGPRSNKTIVLECYRKIIRDLDLSLIDSYIKEDYIQHSPMVKTGRAGLLEMLQFLRSLPRPAGLSPSPITRAIADGDFVAIHLDVKFMGRRMAVIDFYRLEDGKIAEHWDAGQSQPDEQPGPITMTNGIAVIEDSANVNKAKALVIAFYDSVLITGKPEEAVNYLTPGFIEHTAGGGLLTNEYTTVKVHRIIGEGNFIMAQCECKSADKVLAQYHLFKVEDDKIAEHWSVEQEVPATMAHANGMF